MNLALDYQLDRLGRHMPATQIEEARFAAD
jgi:hypothetical protein